MYIHKTSHYGRQEFDKLSKKQIEMNSRLHQVVRRTVNL